MSTGQAAQRDIWAVLTWTLLFASWLERTHSVGEGNLISDKSLQSKSGCLHFVESGGRWLISAVMSTSILHKGISERRWRPLFLFFFGRTVLEGAIQYQIRSSLKSAIGKANLTPADKTLRNVLSGARIHLKTAHRWRCCFLFDISGVIIDLHWSAFRSLMKTWKSPNTEWIHVLREDILNSKSTTVSCT